MEHEYEVGARLYTATMRPSPDPLTALDEGPEGELQVLELPLRLQRRAERKSTSVSHTTRHTTRQALRQGLFHLHLRVEE